MIRIEFAHANGFPASCYGPLLAALSERASVSAVSRYGHAGPISDCWPELVDQLTHHLGGDGRPCYLVGHSLGGYLALMAAATVPSQVLGVVLLDSPVLSAYKATLVWLAKRLRFDDRFSPAGRAVNRRNAFDDRASAFAHFRSKALFARFSDAALEAYIAHGLEPIVDPDNPNAVGLAFTREVETRIYRTLPHHLHQLLPRITVPVGFIAGTDSTEMRLVGETATRQLVGERFRHIEGSHLFPMESPGETSRLTFELIDDMAKMRRENQA